MKDYTCIWCLGKKISVTCAFGIVYEPEGCNVFVLCLMMNCHLAVI